MGCRASDFPVLQYFLEFEQTHVHWVDDAIQPSNPLLLPSPPALNLSRIRVFPGESALCTRWPKYWSFSFSISPNEYSGLIFFRVDWFNLLSKGPSRVFSRTIVWKHQFLGVQPSLWFNSHIHIWLLEKPIALTRWPFVSQVISLLFNMVSRFVVAFLPRGKHPLISWLQLPSAVNQDMTYYCIQSPRD